jgi:hypothetical protein
MTRIRATFACLVLIAGLAVRVDAAPILNGGFETGLFPPWSTIGDTSAIVTLGTIAPVEGAFQALITNGLGSVSQGSLETFFGLTAGALDALGSGDATQGSGIQQSFTANAGETVTFFFNFLTNEATPEPIFNDSSFVVRDGVATLLRNTTGAFFPAPGAFFFEQTLYAQFSYVVPTTGTHTLGFGVVDVGDSIIDSGLLVDSVVAPIPEPGTLALLGLGCLAAARQLRRRKRQQVG